MTNNTIDEITCTAIFKKDSGFPVDLAGGASQNLIITNFRPEPRTYPSDYIKIQNQLGVKGTHTLRWIPSYSKSNSLADTNSVLYHGWDQNLMDFRNCNTCHG